MNANIKKNLYLIIFRTILGFCNGIENIKISIVKIFQFQKVVFYLKQSKGFCFSQKLIFKY